MSLSEFASFCKKKGFFYPSSEIYGGLSGFYDYGHLGTRLKHNFENLWRKYFLSLEDNFHEIETANIMHAKVFKASGHLENFIDPVVACSKCDFQERADHLVEKALNQRVEGLTAEELTQEITNHKLKCQHCGANFKPVSVVNMMFPIQIGVSGAGKSTLAYLRPETAQSPYVNFKLQCELLRNKLPLGLALIGRAYRNEISPRNLILRQREFTQAELQIFFNPAKINEHKYFELVKDYQLKTLLIKDRKASIVIERAAQDLVNLGFPKFYVYHLVKIQQFYLEVLQINTNKFRLYELSEQEKAFYNKLHFDLEIKLTDLGWTEVGGLHYRTDHDLQGHQEISKENMQIFDEQTNTKFIPHVLELSFGVDRHLYALIDLNYEDSKERGNVLLHFPKPLAPYTYAFFPLVKNNPELLAKAEEVFNLFKGQGGYFDVSGSVGRRYARADEIGVNYCITVDFDSLQNNSVTIRDRETTKQVRVKIEDLKESLVMVMTGKSQLEQLGRLVR